MTVLVNHDQIAARSYAFGLVAPGAGQTPVTTVPAMRNVFTTVASGSAVTLDATVYPLEVVIINAGLNNMSVYPPIGWSINGGTVNSPVTVTTNTSLTFISGDPNGNNWWSRA